MRLPYIQIAMELVEQVAPDIAVELDQDELRVLGGLVRMLKWGLGRVPEGELPSHHATVRGPNAARLIARAAGYQGNPDAFVEACERCQPALLERVPDGVRFRGFDRYDVVLENADARSEKARHAANARWGKKGGPDGQSSASAQAMPEHAPSTAPTMLGDAKTQIQTQIHRKEPPPTPSAGFEPLEPLAQVVEVELMGQDPTGIPVPRRARVIRWTPSVEGCWEMLQLNRELHGLHREKARPKGFTAWADFALRSPGPAGIEDAHDGFLEDASIRAKGHPTAVFISPGVWGSRQPAGPGTDPPTALAGPHVDEWTSDPGEVATA